MLNEAIEYPLEGEDTLETFLIGGALFLLSPFVVPSILIGGYSVAVVRTVLDGGSEPPAFDDLEGYLRDGLYVLAISLVYALPGLVLAGIGLGVFVLVSVVGAVNGGVAGVVVLALMGVGTIVGFAYTLAVAYLLPAAIVNFARTGELGAAWDVDALRTIATDGEFAKAWLLAALLLLVTNSVGGMLAPVLVGFVVLFYGQVAAMYLYATGAGNALDVSPEPPAPPTSPDEDATGDSIDDGASSESTSSGDAPDGADSGGEPGTDDDGGVSEGATHDGDGDEEGDGRSLVDVDGVGPATAESLRDGGFETVADLRAATRDDLTDVDGIGPAKADQIKRDVEDT